MRHTYQSRASLTSRRYLHTAFATQAPWSFKELELIPDTGSVDAMDPAMIAEELLKQGSPHAGVTRTHDFLPRFV